MGNMEKKLFADLTLWKTTFSNTATLTAKFLYKKSNFANTMKLSTNKNKLKKETLKDEIFARDNSW